jgi:1-aminocyclopropane-1-carboxylate deaminase/D-cysteine desulfhydrase-like pyridoxal-dependent ACC family enzyme
MNLSLAAGAGLMHVRAEGDDIDVKIFARAEALRAAGRRPYAVPRGGSTPTGALGFADAAHELDSQLRQADISPAAVVVAVGSGGTFAGLQVGATELGWIGPLIGASVSRPLPAIRAKIAALIEETRALRAAVPDLRRPDLRRPDLRRPDLQLVDAIGPGHGQLSDEERDLADLALREEGLLLDSTYTAKSFAVAVATARTARGPVVFWHTGGMATALARSAGHNG